MQTSAEHGVLYLNVGHKHVAHLCVSLLSLRDHYDGPVAILTGGEESDSFLEEYFATEPRFGDLRFIPFEYESLGRGSVYYAKTSMGDLSPFEKTVFLDSDTLVTGNFSEVLPEGDEVRITQFANWTTFSKRIRSRISKWDKILPEHVSEQTNNEYPAINTGVMGFSKGSTEFMKRWHETTVKNICFMCDEICCQLIYTDYPHKVLSDKYNASPKFSWNSHGKDKHGAAIWHGHGKKFLKNSCEVQEALWLPYYRRALLENMASICDWTNNRRKYRSLIRPKKYLSDQQWKTLTAGLTIR